MSIAFAILCFAGAGVYGYNAVTMMATQTVSDGRQCD